MSSSKKTDVKEKSAKKSRILARIPKKIQPFILLIPLLLIGFGVSFVVAQHAGKKNVPSSAATPATKDGKAIHAIDIKSANNQPVDLLIKKDEYVQFNSKDGGKHQIITQQANHSAHSSTDPNDADKTIDSGVFKGDEGYLLQFKKIGEYVFQDKHDSDYTITVIVYDPTKSLEDIKIKP